MEERSHNWITRLGGWGVAGLALLPAALAVWSTERIPAARAVHGESERSSLVFSQYAVNLGEIPPTATIPVPFDFHNAGDRPLTLVKLDPSCGCLAPRVEQEKMSYAPGESGRFVVSVKTANESAGPKEYRVRVQYDDGRPREQLVHFRMVIPHKKVTVAPSELYFYQLNGKADWREIVVEDHRGGSLTVQGAAISSGESIVTVGEKYRHADGHWATPIRIDVPARPNPGKEIVMLTVRTDDSEYPEIRVPILIYGPTQPIQLTGGEDVPPQGKK